MRYFIAFVLFVVSSFANSALLDYQIVNQNDPICSDDAEVMTTTHHKTDVGDVKKICVNGCERKGRLLGSFFDGKQWIVKMATRQTKASCTAKCKDDETLNKQTKQCEKKQCPKDYKYNKKTQECEPEKKQCKNGYQWNKKLGICDCPTSKNKIETTRRDGLKQCVSYPHCGKNQSISFDDETGFYSCVSPPKPKVCKTSSGAFKSENSQEVCKKIADFQKHLSYEEIIQKNEKDVCVFSNKNSPSVKNYVTIFCEEKEDEEDEKEDDKENNGKDNNDKDDDKKDDDKKDNNDKDDDKKDDGNGGSELCDPSQDKDCDKGKGKGDEEGDGKGECDPKKQDCSDKGKGKGKGECDPKKQKCDGFCNATEFTEKVCGYVDDTKEWIDSLITDEDLEELKPEDTQIEIQECDPSQEVCYFPEDAKFSISFGSAQCPANTTFTMNNMFSNKTYTLFDWVNFCQIIATKIRPIVIFLFSISAVYVLGKEQK